MSTHRPALLAPSKFTTSAGRTIYSIPVRAFTALVANIYVIDDGSRHILIDAGSGMEDSNQDLMDGLAAIEETFGEPIRLSELEAILITHGHIDHFGGLPFLRQHTDAPIGVHPLDRRVLSHYEERVVVASRRLESFLQQAGVPADHRANLMAMYLFAKSLYHSTPTQFSLEEGRLALGDIAVYHVPGHCPGQVCLGIDDFLLTADHVLSRTTPHQAPESITNHMGLGHYLDSLEKIARLDGVRQALGGHEEPITDLNGRVDEIRLAHEDRLEKVLEICQEPTSIAEISLELFGRVGSYHILLALEEAGAHVEYLYQLGELVAVNVAEIESSPQPVILYRRF
jgi:glyoxylase-like metal-dependent hydrolase (beta-lactamase superfamily II)